MNAATRLSANRRTPTLKALLILFLCAGLVGAWVSVFPTWALADELAEEGDAVKVDEPELTAQADDFQGNIWLDGENRVFSDSSLTMHLQHQGIEDPYVLHVYVGRWDQNPADGELLNQGDGYTYNAESGEIMLDGGWLFERDFDRVRVSAQVWYEPEDATNPDTDWYLVRSEDRWIDVYERVCDREQDRDLLPGEDGFVNGRFHAYIKGASHPEGLDFDCEVFDVQVISGEELLKTFDYEDDGDNHWWYYRVGDESGTVEFKVTFSMYDGAIESYTLKLNVSNFDIRCSIIGNTAISPEDNGLNRGFPGQDIKLRAQGVQLQSHLGYPDITGGFTYDWQIVEGSDCAHVESQMDGDASIATVHFEDYFESDFYHRDVKVRVTASKDETSIEHEFYLEVSNEYPEIWIEETSSPSIDSNMAPGTTQQVTPLVRYNNYWSSDLCHIENIRWIFDSSKLKITYLVMGAEVNSGDNIIVGSQHALPFNLERLNGDDCDVEIQVDWRPGENQHPEAADEYGLRHESMRFHLNHFDENYDLWFDENKHDIDLWVTRNENGTFSDFADVTNTLVLSDTLEAVGGLTYEWTVGTWENDCWDQIFGPDSGLYTISGDGKSIISNAAAMAEQGVRNLRVSAAVNLGGEHLETHNDFWFHLREREDWFDREQDRDMLPGDTNTVFRWYNRHLCNQEHPDGFDEQYEVIDVATSNDSVVSVERQDWDAGEQDDHNWRYTAKDKGTATLTVFYQMLDGAQDSYTFDVHVGSDVYFVQMWSDDDAYNVLPGSTVEIHAQGMHRREGQPDTDEGLTYDWEIVQGADVCKALEVDSTDPKHVTVRIKTPAEAGKMGFDDNVAVRVHLNDGSNTNVAENEWHVRVANVFQEIYPTSVDSGLCVGKSEQVKLELRQYLYGQDEFTTINDAQFSFRFDDSCISITDEAGNEVSSSEEGPSEAFHPAGTYTVTRKGDWNTNVNVHAIWAERNEIRDTHRDWWFERPNQEIRFMADEYKTNENCAAVVKLDVSSVSHIPDYADSMVINIGNIDTHTFEDALTNPIYSVSKGDSVWTITIPGAVLAEKGCSELVVDALFNMKGEYSLVTGNETRVSLTNDPTHIISHVNATAPTPTKDGVKEHYCCDNCGATFADEAGTQPVSMDDLAIVLANQVISVTNKSVAMGKTVSLNAKVTTGSGKLSYKSFNNKVAKVDSNGVVTPVSVGKTTITVTAAASGNYKATSKNVTVTVTKGVSPITVKAKAITAAKNKKTTFKKDSVFTIKKAKGTVTFKKVKGDKHIVVKKNGTIIVKKGLTKKFYQIKVKVTDPGNTNWKSKSKTITLKVKAQ